MVRAYLDESGTHEGSPIVVVAGWMGNAKVWKSFVKEWSIHLKREGISYFHAQDSKCESLREPLSHAILKRKLMGVAWAVNPLDFKKNASERFMSQFGNAYSTCAFLCAGLISGIVKKYSYESVALVFEAGQKNEIFIHETIRAMMEGPEEHRIASINFLNKKDPGAIPLQAADFLAHIISSNETKWVKKFEGKVEFVMMPPDKIKISSRKIESLISKQRELRRRARKN